MSDWQPIKTAPRCRKLLLGYRNRLGNWRTALGMYYPPKTLEWGEDYDGDDEYAPEGWYEATEESDEILTLSGPLLFWMSLPAPPATHQEDFAAIRGAHQETGQ